MMNHLWVVRDKQREGLDVLCEVLQRSMCNGDSILQNYNSMWGLPPQNISQDAMFASDDVVTTEVPNWCTPVCWSPVNMGRRCTGWTSRDASTMAWQEERALGIVLNVKFGCDLVNR